MDHEQIRDRVVTAMGPHVVFDGWTPASMRAAASDVGVTADQIAHAFPDGVVGAVEHFLDLNDRRMLAELDAQDMRDTPLRQRLAGAVRLRLELIGDREVMRRALSVLALPMNATAGLRSTYRTVDAIMSGIGDESTDFTFYTKRLGLAGLYSATLLFWLGDTSEGSHETWDFLDRRIGEIMQLGKVREEIERRIASLPTPSRLFAKFRGRGFPGGRTEFMGL